MKLLIRNQGRDNSASSHPNAYSLNILTTTYRLSAKLCRQRQSPPGGPRAHRCPEKHQADQSQRLVEFTLQRNRKEMKGLNRRPHTTISVVDSTINSIHMQTVTMTFYMLKVSPTPGTGGGRRRRQMTSRNVLPGMEFVFAGDALPYCGCTLRKIGCVTSTF